MDLKLLPIGIDDFDCLRREGYQNIIKYGIAFYRKECMVKVE